MHYKRFRQITIALFNSLMLSSVAFAESGLPDFDTWCPGGDNLSQKNGVYYVNQKPVKTIAEIQGQVRVLSGKSTFTVEKYPDGLQVSVSGTPAASGICTVEADIPKHVNHSERAGQGQFQATGEVPCAQSKGQPMRSCPFGVARDNNGDASVRVQLAEGRYRFIFFSRGKATSADLTQADGDMTFKATKEADLYMIKAGHERYEIPEAVVFGG